MASNVPAGAAILASGDVDPSFGGIDPWVITQSLRIGDRNPGSLEINGGSSVLVDNSYSYFGVGATGSADVTVTGTGSHLQMLRHTYIANFNSAATLMIADGATAEMSSVDLSADGGMVHVTGVGSVWDVYYLDVTQTSGSGVFSSILVDDGGVVNSTNVELRSGSTSSNTTTVSGPGSAWNVALELKVHANNGTGILQIENGASVSADTLLADGAIDPTDTAAFIVNGVGSTLDAATSMTIGLLQSGELRVEDGGAFSTPFIEMGVVENTTGKATVSGAGSHVQVNGDIRMGERGHGILNITDGGVMDVTGDIQAMWGQDGRGSIHLDGGTLNAGGVVLSTDEMTGVGTINTYGLVADTAMTFDSTSGANTQVVLNSLPGQNVVINVDASGAAGVGPLGVGMTGSGVMTVTDGVAVTSSRGDVGYKNSADGTVHITGAGSSWTIQDELMMNTGEINITGGGALNSADATVANFNDAPGETGSVLVDGVGSTWASTGSTYIGDYGAGELTIRNGAVVNHDSVLLAYSGTNSTGIVRVSGSGSLLNMTYGIGVGRNGHGTLVIENGGSVVGGTGSYVSGKAATESSVLVTGAGSSWDMSGRLNIGGPGGGTVRVENQGVINGTEGLIAEDDIDSASVTVTGVDSVWTLSETLTVGDEGHGTLLIEGGGQVTSSAGRVGNRAGSNGLATVTGAGSTWDNTYWVFVGADGTGRLDIVNGGAVTSGGARIGRYNDSSGVVNVDGTDASWISSGQMVVEETGTLNILNGATVQTTEAEVNRGRVDIDGAGSTMDVTGLLQIGLTGTFSSEINVANGGTLTTDEVHFGQNSGSGGEVNVTGAGSSWTHDGELYVGQQGGNYGYINIADGGTLNSQTSYLGYPDNRYRDTFGEATVTGAGSTWTSNGVLYVGHEQRNRGTLTIEDGGTVTSTAGYLAANHNNSTGTAAVTGTDSLWDMSGVLIIGKAGDGQMTISQGGTVRSASGYLGDDAGSTGSVTITGIGSVWEAGGVYVGAPGQGTLRIENGGLLESATGFLGSGTGSSGMATVTGSGSRWTSPGNGGLIVGGGGPGELSILAGGAVSLRDARVGGAGGGTVTVNGVGSTWTLNDVLLLGYNGAGTLRVEDGGVATNLGYAHIGSGSAAGTAGDVTVTGAGSFWQVGQYLFVGKNGPGELKIENGGHVQVDGYLWIDPDAAGHGSVHFTNGALDTASLATAPSSLLGTGTVNTAMLFTDADLVFDTASGLQKQFVYNQLPGQDVTINLDASGSTGAGPMGAGYQSTGTLTIADGYAFAAELGYVGYLPGSDGTVTVTGTGSAWDLTETLFVGDEGTGVLNIENGAEVASLRSYVGSAVGADGTIHVNGVGSAWHDTGTSYIGYYGDGQLTIENGAVATASGARLADRLDATGYATITGAGSTWQVDGFLMIGAAGDAGMTVENGGRVTSYASDIGSGNRQADVDIRGVGSLWQVDGNLTVGRNGGQTTLTIEAGGAVDVTGTTHVDIHGNGSHGITLNNGTLTTTGLWASDVDVQGVGTIHTQSLLSDIALDLNTNPASLRGQIVLDALPGQSITIHYDYSDNAANQTLGAGYKGVGSLLVSGGLQVQSVHGYVGYHEGSSGTVRVTGQGTKWVVTDELTVGREGTGIMSIDTGGLVSVGDDLRIGDYSDAAGYVYLLGGTLRVEGALYGGAGFEAFTFTGGRLEGVDEVDLREPFVQSGGVFAPGDGPERVVLRDDYLLNAGTLELDIGGVDNAYDYLDMNWGADVVIALTDTTLHLNPTGPMQAGLYRIIDTYHPSDLSGRFEHVTGLGSYPGLVDILYNPIVDGFFQSSGVYLRLNADFLPGDLDGDGFVGIDDLNTILVAWNQNVTPGDLSAGDITGDGFIGIGDLTAVLGNWNTGAPPSPSAIPEPAGLTLLSLGGLVLLCRSKS